MGGGSGRAGRLAAAAPGTIAAGLGLAAGEARGCSFCLAQDSLLAFPPAGYWTALGFVWLIGLLVIGARLEVRPVGYPSRGALVGALIASVLIALFGGLIAAWFAPYAIGLYILILAVRPGLHGERLALHRPRLDHPTARRIRRFSIVMIALAMITGLAGYAPVVLMDPVELALLKEDGKGGLYLDRALERGASGNEAARTALRRTRGPLAGAAARHLAVHGDAARDVPLLIDAFERLRQPTGSRSPHVTDLQAILDAIRGLCGQDEDAFVREGIDVRSTPEELRAFWAANGPVR